MTKYDKEIKELEEELRSWREVNVLTMQNILRLKERLMPLIDCRVKEYPELYEVEFLKEYDFTDEELRKVLALRKKRIQQQ